VRVRDLASVRLAARLWAIEKLANAVVIGGIILVS
jgi:hypothetical protein